MIALEKKWDGTAPTVTRPKIASFVSTAKLPYVILKGSTTGTKVEPEQIRARPSPAARGRLTATLPSGAVIVTGQVAKALAALVHSGAAGVTALEMSSWAYRLGAYVHTLRRDCGLAIETVREPHEGGWHGRYVLHSPVVIAEPTP